MTMWLDLKKHFEARAIEWFNALYLAAWGAYLILHPGIFTGPAREGWAGLMSIAAQETWGFGAFCFGSIRVVALFINGQWGLTPLIRVATSFTSVFVWFWVLVGLVKTGIPHTGIVLYGGLMLADMYSAFRAAADAYEAEAMKRLEQLSKGSASVASIGNR